MRALLNCKTKGRAKWHVNAVNVTTANIHVPNRSYRFECWNVTKIEYKVAICSPTSDTLHKQVAQQNQNYVCLISFDVVHYVWRPRSTDKQQKQLRRRWTPRNTKRSIAIMIMISLHCEFTCKCCGDVPETQPTACNLSPPTPPLPLFSSFFTSTCFSFVCTFSAYSPRLTRSVSWSNKISKTKDQKKKTTTTTRG